jgi:multimeric flavodoxin WrbA
VILARAVLDGAGESWHTGALVDLGERVSGLLRDCRARRDANGDCTIDDGFAALLLDKVLQADGVVVATPLYWYGVSGALKTFIDRIFCFASACYPKAEDVCRRLPGRRLSAVISAEETYFGATLGVEGSMQKLTR